MQNTLIIINNKTNDKLFFDVPQNQFKNFLQQGIFGKCQETP